MVAGSVPACDLKLEGADSVLKGMQGGLDGLYEVSSCESGLPTYKRKDSKPNGVQGWCSQVAALKECAHLRLQCVNGLHCAGCMCVQTTFVNLHVAEHTAAQQQQQQGRQQRS